MQVGWVLSLCSLATAQFVALWDKGYIQQSSGIPAAVWSCSNSVFLRGCVGVQNSKVEVA